MRLPLTQPDLPSVDLIRVPTLDPPLQVINMTGLGRSGSTLLGQLLAEVDGVTYVGELDKLWRRGYLQDALCSCRQPFSTCPFWSEVDRLAFGGGGLDRHTAEELVALDRIVLRKRRLRELAANGWPDRPRAEDGRRLLEYRRRVYWAIRAVSGARWILDAGKTPVYGLLMSHAEPIDLHVVHIVRDPRAVAWSWQRRVQSDDLPEAFPIVTATRIAHDWTVVNGLADSLLRRRSRSFTLVRYEDLVADAGATLQRVAAAIGIDSATPEVVDGSVTLRRAGHYLAGNPGRRTGGASVRVRLDDEWMSRLSAADRRTVDRRCLPLMVRYGYRR